MESVLDKQIVLSLNSSWQPIGWRTVKQAMISLNGGDSNNPPAMALDIQMDEAGKLVYANPLKWDAWKALPIREGDLAVLVKNGAIRAPLAIISCNFAKVPLKAPRLTRKAILERDGFTCAYSGRKLHPSRLNVDHVIPRDRGGRDEWGNLVACDREINSKKGNRLNSEVGLVLQKLPKAPKALPVSYGIEPKHPHHVPFLGM
jgi:hypothetical protein